ncbi:hypothetical protein A9Q78_08070 [Methylophaga sp. 41_12_T18]|nr:hypothetical protein A9Q78_08070 [Methylophaga sp. 41_12_T18]
MVCLRKYQVYLFVDLAHLTLKLPLAPVVVELLVFRSFGYMWPFSDGRTESDKLKERKEILRAG